jgi:hypothetical protein
LPDPDQPDRAVAVDAWALAGATCVVAGVGWIYMPAGLILLGLVCLMVAAVKHHDEHEEKKK